MKNLNIIAVQMLLTIFTVAILCAQPSIAQPPTRTTPAEYIQKYKSDAIKDMNKMGVPASITLAQGILESDCGNSELAREARNHFGIKCHKEWTGEFYIKDDDTKDECFRKYNNVLESFDDHGRFLRERPRYAFLFEYEITDYKSWAHGLKKAGYATNPKYADLLIKIIEEHDLAKYDRGGHSIPVATAVEQPVANNQLSASSKNTSTPVKTHRSKSSTKVNANEVPFVYAKTGDSWLSVATHNDIRVWQVKKYNDAGERDELNEGDIVYLKPKRGRPDTEIHTVQKGDNMRMISQKYGVKLKKILKLNQIDVYDSIKPGQKIKLK